MHHVAMVFKYYTCIIIYNIYYVFFLQVHLQTQQEGRTGLWGMGKRVLRTQGIAGLYNGLSASLTRQVWGGGGDKERVCNFYH